MERMGQSPMLSGIQPITINIMLNNNGSLLNNGIKRSNGVFPNGAELSPNSVKSEKMINHPSMNWAQFKDPISHVCLAGTVVACWSLTQGWQVRVLVMS